MAAPLQDNEKDALIARLQNENRSLIQEQSMLGLNYNHKKEDGIEARHLANNDIPVFTRIPELSTVKPDEDIDHLLIEGDNLPALVALLPTYRGKVNVIYIDPPYNTGNQDFVYNDRYVDSEDGFRHSKWLSFMKPRLQLAHEMLSDDGVIFVSIDDHEQAYLKVMMDEVFGEQNKVNDFIWMNNLKGRQLSNGGAATTYEHILCYAKKPGTKKFSLNASYASNLMPLVYSKQKYRILKDEEGEYALKNELFNTNSKFNEQSSPSMVFNIHYNGHDVKFSSIDSDTVYDGYTTIRPHVNSDGEHRYHAWRWSKKKIAKDLKDLIFIKDCDKYKIYTKVRSFNETSMKDVISNISTGNIDSILGKHKFQNPKPVSLIKLLIDVSTSQSSLILDFFAGSGTTGQAVAELNKEDGGHRKCILITNNFEQDGAPNGIARDITSVRMKRVLTGKEWADGKEHEPLPGNLIYYRLDWQPMSTSLTNLPGMLPLSTFLGSLSINQQTHRLMTIPDDMPTLSKLVKDGHAALLTNENSKHTVLALDADTSDDFDALDTVKAELESSNLLEGLDVAMESGFDTDTYMDSGVFDHEFTFPVPDIIQMQATVRMLKKDGVISINDDQEDHTHMNNDNNDNNKENR